MHRLTSLTILAATALTMASCTSKQQPADTDGHQLWFKSLNMTNIAPNDAPTERIIAENILRLNTNRRILKMNENANDTALGAEGFSLAFTDSTITIEANSQIGILYGSFELLRMQESDIQFVSNKKTTSVPAFQHRILNHWDNLDGSVERGYAGSSLWDWATIDTTNINANNSIYAEYARANASIGINGTVLNNVNANADILTKDYLLKVKTLADIFRPYGLKVYLSLNFAAPKHLAGLKTSDPLNKEVINWWNTKIAEIYKLIPDFGGFLVKANSEGQSGPQDYGRTHADGANMIADALRPYGGIVMWRAFVYNAQSADRAKQAVEEFMPLDGQFRDNVLIQIKNGPIDFQPREPFSPLFGQFDKTQSMVEVQITQEYLGHANHLVFLHPMWKECLDSDTYKNGEGSTVGKITEGKLMPYKYTAIAGVANIGNNANWCGHHFAQANWYAYGRLTWNTTLAPDSIAQEWIRQTIPGMPQHAENTLVDVLMESREAVVDYMMPLGLHHIFAWGHHYGPEPWCNIDGARADWMPRYYHRADKVGIGSDRSSTGSNAVAQYNEPISQLYNDIATCPDEYLLWFHHVKWNYVMKSGRTLWNELCFHYDRGLTMTGHFIASWKRIKPYVSPELWNDVNNRLVIQCDDARWWHDACLLYFQQYSAMPIPQKTIYKLSDMQQFRINISNYENPKQGYRGEKYYD